MSVSVLLTFAFYFVNRDLLFSDSEQFKVVVYTLKINKYMLNRKSNQSIFL